MSYMEDPRVATDSTDSLGFPNLLYRKEEPQEGPVAGIIAYKWGLRPAAKGLLGGVVSLMSSTHSLKVPSHELQGAKPLSLVISFWLLL